MPRDMLFGERRLYERKSYTVDVDIEANDRYFSCLMRNLSLGGAFIEPPNHFKPRIGKELTITIPFRNRRGYVVVKGKIARAIGSGLAVVFLR